MTTATLRISTPYPQARTAPKTAARKGIFARFYDALMEARMRQAVREIRMHQHLLPENVKKDLGALPFVRGA